MGEEVKRGLTEMPSGRFLIIGLVELRWEIDMRIVLCLVPGIAISVGIHVLCEGASGMRKGGGC